MIREATYSDLNRLVSMGEKFHQKSDMDAPYRDEDAVGFLVSLIENPHAVVLISEGGMIGVRSSVARCAMDMLM